MTQTIQSIANVQRIDGSLGLLVSVRSAAEARMALAAGVDLIDIKEPQAGSLGAASAATIREIAATVSGRVPLSVALGELSDSEYAQHLLDGIEGVRYAKLGLAGVAKRSDWFHRWRAQITRLPQTTGAVAVVYADWRRVGAPSPRDVLKRAAEFGCQAVLVDTCNKDHGNLLAHWPIEQIRAFVQQIQRNQMLAVMGGSLTATVLAAIAATGTDYVAVRGAVCLGQRDGPIDRDRLREFRQDVRDCRTVERPISP